MWTNFVAACLFAVVLLYLPGCLVLGSSIVKSKVSFAWAPFISLSLLVVLGEVFFMAGVGISGLALFCAAVVLACLISLLKALFYRWLPLRSAEEDAETKLVGGEFRFALLYVCMGLLVSVYAFVSAIGSPDWFSTEIDNAFHLNEIYAMASTGQFSAFSISLYQTVQGFGSADNTSFYPALWHMVAAILLDVVAVSAPVAENAANFVFVAVAFPLGVWSFLATIFDGNKKAVIAGSITCVCFFDFPWRLLTFGLLCSNLAAFAMVPAALSLFVSFAKVESRGARRISLVVQFVLACLCLALLQPNAVFSCVVLLFFFCIGQILHGGKLFGFRIRGNRRYVIALVLVVVCFAFWMLAYKAPFMQGVMSTTWEHVSSKVQGIFNIALLSYRKGPANPIMALLVLVGIISVLRNKSLRWLAGSYLLCAIIHYSTASTESAFKHLLSGFWYTDPFRTAALCVIAAIPLSAIGLDSVASFVEGLVGVLKKNGLTSAGGKGAARAFLLTVAVLLLLPNFALNGVGAVTTTIGEARAKIQSDYDMSDEGTLTTEEVGFVKKAKQIVGDDLVINSPFDGTAFLYGVTGVQFYYRTLPSFLDDDPGESIESRTLRHSLSSYANDDSVRSVLEQINAKYVLLLDSSRSSERRHVFTYRPEEWLGIDSVSEAADGFELVLEEGDMKLYRING